MFQDKYLEWSLARDDSDNILSITFTCEGLEVSERSSPLAIEANADSLYQSTSKFSPAIRKQT